MIILGIAGGHDAGWCIVQDGKIIGAFEKERFTKKRHDSGEVISLIPASLKKLNLDIKEVDVVATSEPVHRNTECGLIKLGGKKYKYPHEWVNQTVEVCNRILPCISVPHHLSHAAYAYYTSPFFHESAALTWDGGGDFYTEDAYSSTTISMWKAGRLEWLKRIDNSDFGSLWFTYSKAIFGDGNAAGKLMGLAAYGTDALVEPLKDRFFAFVDGMLSGAITIKNCWPDFLNPPFLSNNPSWRDPQIQDLAFAIQAITEEAGLSLVNKFASIVNSQNLVLGGGVTLNGYLNTKIKKGNSFKNVFVPPSVHDGGISVGCALFASYHVLGIPWKPNSEMDIAFLGQAYTDEETKKILNIETNIKFCKIKKEDAEEKAVKALEKGKVIAWYAGRSEHGPRALGNRSILALPHLEGMKNIINKKIKFREEFRPVAPVVLEDDASLFFDMDWTSPYMMYIVNAKDKWKNIIPSALHVDNTARVQTVTTSTSLGKITSGVRDMTGVGCILNTSFNVNTPIVETPKDALSAFKQVPMDAMYLNGYWVEK